MTLAEAVKGLKVMFLNVLPPVTSPLWSHRKLLEPWLLGAMLCLCFLYRGQNI